MSTSTWNGLLGVNCKRVLYRVKATTKPSQRDGALLLSLLHGLKNMKSSVFGIGWLCASSPLFVESFACHRRTVRSVSHCQFHPWSLSATTSSQSGQEQQQPSREAKVSKRRKRRRPATRSKKNSQEESAFFVGPLTLRVFGVEVHPDLLPTPSNKSQHEDESIPAEKKWINAAVVDALLQRLRLGDDATSNKTDDWEGALSQAGIASLRVIRRSLDARPKKRRVDGGTGPRFVYALDIDLAANSRVRGTHRPGRLERIEKHEDSTTEATTATKTKELSRKRRVVIVGAGPAGLFCALQLARSGVVQPILLERGQPVESRGKDIGALMHRRSLDSESNFAFGEGGAGTWSDGKLTTRIGRNSEAVRHVLETLVEYGAPDNILVDGAPHLGTDNLVRLLRNMRQDLRQLGGEIHFGSKVTQLIIEDGRTKGVEFQSRVAIERNTGVDVAQMPADTDGKLLGEAVVLATGHSARDVYENLHKSGVKLETKGFAVGFRVEHPQWLINKIQYGSEWGPTVVTGRTKTDKANESFFATMVSERNDRHNGRLPVPSYRLATDQAYDGVRQRGVYSFCMCPGGQIVPASTDPEEVSVNGMSFSRRDSVWANSALVVSIAPNDPILEPYRDEHGVLAGVAFQRDMERRASVLGGGNLTVPVQRITDFIAGEPSTTAPSSSYRLGIRPAACHEIYPQPLVSSLRDALTNHFEKTMPGFICDEALLHAVETRTSSPVRISRDDDSLQAVGTQGLFPAGEGAGRWTDFVLSKVI